MKHQLKFKNLGTTVIKETDIKEDPFNITFNWNKESIKIQLTNGEDLFKIAYLFSKFLDKNDINHTIT